VSCCAPKATIHVHTQHQCSAVGSLARQRVCCLCCIKVSSQRTVFPGTAGDATCPCSWQVLLCIGLTDSGSTHLAQRQAASSNEQTCHSCTILHHDSGSSRISTCSTHNQDTQAAQMYSTTAASLSVTWAPQTSGLESRICSKLLE
jgi:hypothetical protein